MADENIQIINVENSDGSKKHFSSLDGMRYINTNIGALSGGVDIAIGAQGLVLQTNTNDPPNAKNTIIYNNLFTNSVGDINSPTTTYSTDLMTLAKLDSTIPAVQIAPSSNVLKINNSILLDDGGGNNGTLGTDLGGNIILDPSNNLIVDGNLDMSGNSILQTPSISNLSGNIEIKCDITGAGGSIILTGGTDLISVTSSGASGQYLKLTINGNDYKIKLENV